LFWKLIPVDFLKSLVKYPFLLLLLALLPGGYQQLSAHPNARCNSISAPAQHEQASLGTEEKDESIFLFTSPESAENQRDGSAILFFENEKDDKVETDYCPSLFTVAPGYYFSYSRKIPSVPTYLSFTPSSHRYLVLQIFRI